MSNFGTQITEWTTRSPDALDGCSPTQEDTRVDVVRASLKGLL